MHSQVLKIPDDSGFLALVVPATYETFVAEDWTFAQILRHFEQQMSRRSLLIWGTGAEGYWRVDCSTRKSRRTGFREVSGPLTVSGGSVLVTNYESLTMAAQFRDVTLPEPNERDQILRLEDGDYECRIMQMFDPEANSGADDSSADFFMELSKTRAQNLPWTAVPWFDK